MCTSPSERLEHSALILSAFTCWSWKLGKANVHQVSLTVSILISRRDILSCGDAVACIAEMNSVVASAVRLLSQNSSTESYGDEGSKASHVMTRVLVQESRLNGWMWGLLLLVANSAGVLYPSS
jgi:hypothetical protein